MVVGLTGGIGSGKTTVLNFFKKFNIATYIADKEAKLLMHSSKEIRTNLIAKFGKETYKNNQLNRSLLASIVFNNKEQLAKLNSIVHPVVYSHLQEFIIKNKNKDYILYENAILFENNSDAMCNKIITVTAPENIKIKRVIVRDNCTAEEVVNRMKNQWKDIKKIVQSNYVINNISLKETEMNVLKIHNILTKNRV